MAATRRLSQLLESTSSRLDLPPGPLAAALSGGADSAALAYLALRAGREVTAVHIDHGFSDSGTMSSAAEAVAGALDISLRTIEVDVGRGPSPEDQAREARYEALHSLDEQVLTGHTRDDNVETVLMNLIRGTGVRGLGGIPPYRAPNVHRPMLEVTRDETREIAALAGLPFVDDPMKRDMALTRNRVRLVVLPRMREINPQVVDAVARLTGMARGETEFLDELAAPHVASVIPVSVLLTLPVPIAERVMHQALEAHGVGVTADRIERMWQVARGESDRQELAGGRHVTRDGALLAIE
ncbi:MAG TPA: tRNA lysidine(34) synthetase TilS [Acidimicrobiia bacterium]|nr:tRNA lysidine(34) synthetase TilS [Acidimicrobiia bacterium]